MRYVIGVDCAVDPRNVGLALGIIEQVGVTPRVRIVNLAVASPTRMPLEIIEQWIEDLDGPILLALDAPLGWPRGLGEVLSRHDAGLAIPTIANELFRRRTDIFVKETIGKLPLDVGADRIARTAHAALHLLGELGHKRGGRIPLAWSGEISESLSAIEVYPAAVLVSRGLARVSYKKKEQVAARSQILSAIEASEVLFLSDGVREEAIRIDHCLDALLCIIAGVDFLDGNVMQPLDRACAEKEGWIWFRPLTA